MAAVILKVVWESVTKFEHSDVRTTCWCHDHPNKCVKNICSCVKIFGTPSPLLLCIGSPMLKRFG